MALYLLRHGALPPNPQRRFVGQRDLPLSPRGQRQIAFWAKELAVTPLKAIFCSSLQRCRESARSIGRYHPQTPVIPRDAFREIHLGQWEGLTPAEVEERFPGAYAARGRNLADYCPQGGESFRMLARRVLPALRDILPQNNDDNVLLTLRQVVHDRREHPQEGSYTCYLFDKGLDKILKKCGEECSEVIIAAKNGKNEDTANEICDLIYHLLVMMVESGIPLEDVEKILAERRQKIGNLKKFHVSDHNT